MRYKKTINVTTDHVSIRFIRNVRKFPFRKLGKIEWILVVCPFCTFTNLSLANR